MSAKFFALLTVIGANKLAKATALGTTLKITQMAVGDGGGTLPTPDTQQTKLVGEKRRAGLNTLFVDPKNDSQIIAEQVIPENEGGYWIREIGLFDDEGSLIAVGNCPETYKPQLQEGSGRTQTIRMILTVSHTESVELKVDPSVILATREFVNDAIESASKEILKAVEETYATKEDVKKKFNIDNVVHEKGASKEKVISQFGVTEFFQPKGAYPTKTEMTLELNKKIDKSSISQQLGNDVNKVPSLDLVTKELGKKQAAGNYALKTDLDNYQQKGDYAPAGNYVTVASMNLELNKKIDKSSISQQLANDVNKVPSLDLMVKELGKKQAAGSYVQTSRKINNKPLSTDISLTADDVGAYSKTESDSRYQPKGVYDNIPVGSPIPWSLTTAPSGYLICNGQTFNKSTYPKLALAYPSGILPDLRGLFIRGFDDSRGFDVGRKILSYQEDSMQKIMGSTVTDSNAKSFSGAFQGGDYLGGQSATGNPGGAKVVKFDSSLVTRTSNETRPKNISFLYIVRAA